MNDIFCFDLDGTITTTELLPLIATEVDLMHEFNVLTRLTMDGVIPFEDSMRLRCAILRSIPITTVQKIVASVPLFDGVVEFIKSRPDVCYIVTGNLDVWVRLIHEKIGCGLYSSIALANDNVLASVEYIMHKSDPINDLRCKYPNSRIISIGDGYNDIPMFESSDVNISCGLVHEPHASLINVSDYIVYDERALCRVLNML
ncbi:Phosphoserine phosphatase [Vibrio stylophorae]|uniref:phosphoserine phosphatase n=1 Tax=Vibrio stylophorae TaxID=659351 RepID=A0ABM8ZWJ7_9VIBR|nr:HAD-IB family phosphatase [Vibrio stylophorae]CAH0534703.1 Phosphoserine phosphatase [Vibrio stylophorae]